MTTGCSGPLIREALWLFRCLQQNPNLLPVRACPERAWLCPSMVPQPIYGVNVSYSSHAIFQLFSDCSTPITSAHKTHCWPPMQHAGGKVKFAGWVSLLPHHLTCLEPASGGPCTSWAPALWSAVAAWWIPLCLKLRLRNWTKTRPLKRL